MATEVGCCVFITKLCSNREYIFTWSQTTRILENIWAWPGPGSYETQAGLFQRHCTMNSVRSQQKKEEFS